jgi:NAD(P)-dependent dehydrogenase (short-subunit alcohol dehydrogenase family)
MSIQLTSQTVLIAGGSSGVGLALARKALAAGAQVHIVGRSAEKLDAAREMLASAALTTHQADIGDERQVQALASRIQRVDHLITTAAELTFKPFVEMNRADIDSTLAAKLWGPLNLIMHFHPKLAPSGSITFYTGSAAYKANHGASIVALANAGLDGLTRTLALELAPVRVNAISPGVFDSPTWNFIPQASRKLVLEEIGSALPVGRVGTVDELADAGMFVMGNGFTTGTVLQIDGGANV